MTEVERLARLDNLWRTLAEADGLDSAMLSDAKVARYIRLAHKLSETHAVLPREPGEATIDEMAAQIMAENLDIMIEETRAFLASTDNQYREIRERLRRRARASYRAAVEGGE